MVLIPLHADQPDTAALVEKAGAGGALNDPTPATIADAVFRILKDRDFRARAGKIANEIADLPDTEATVDEMMSVI